MIAAKWPRPSERGLSIVGILIVIAIVASLVGLLIQSMISAKEKSRMSSNVSNLKQLMTSLVAYEIDFNSYPVIDHPIWHGPAATVEIAAQRTGSTFELLSAHQNLATKLFNNPISRLSLSGLPRPIADIQADPAGGWSDVANNGGSSLNYAYDWSVPGTAAASVRVVLADRATLRPWRGQRVMAAFADSHLETINVDPYIAEGFFNDSVDGPTGRDHIFNDAGDEDMSLVGGGSTTRAFLR